MRDVVFVTFDLPRSDYPSLSYSIASIMASVKLNGFNCSHYSIDIRQILEGASRKQNISELVKVQLAEALGYFKKFRFVAISVTRWSIEHTLSLIEMLSDTNCKIILGGYEITAISNDLLEKEFPSVHFFIKGYAEKALVKILRNEYSGSSKIISEQVNQEDLVSPYTTGIINPFTRKLYWETKRGCTYRCGFCEWGNAEKTLVKISNERLEKEIELFKNSCVEEINILDGVFNHGLDFFNILDKLIKNTDALITFQARFENLIGKRCEKILDFCELYKDRVHMEFGLQTIHQNEMDVIGRKNNLEKVIKILELLNSKGINYEVSIIYAIPGQTVESFIDTIEFLLNNGCKTIRAYPLQIPRNSTLEANKEKLNIEFTVDKFNVKSVESSFSFPKENRRDMDRIASMLNADKIQVHKIPEENLNSLRKLTDYQYELTEVKEWINKKNLHAAINNFYIDPTIYEINLEDVTQYFIKVGELHREFLTEEVKDNYFKTIISGEYSYKLEKWDYDDSNTDPKYKVRRNPNLKPKLYHCRVRVSKSGNIYVFRDIELI